MIKHGSLPNGWAWLLSHGALGALNAKVNGGNATAGALSAAGAELVVSIAAEKLFGDKALDKTGKFNADRLSEDEKKQLSALGAATGAVLGMGVVAQNAVENNYLSERDIAEYKKEISVCVKNKNQSCMEDVIARLKQKNEENRQKLNNACVDRSSSECAEHKELAQGGLAEINKNIIANYEADKEYQNDIYEANDKVLSTVKLPTVEVLGKSSIFGLTGFSVKKFTTSENLKDIAYAEENRGNAQIIRETIDNNSISDDLIYKVATNTLNAVNPSIWNNV